MDTCDVLIVGGGPAGSACAWRLKHAGLDVLVMDRARFPRHKVCAGWITPQVVECLRIDMDDYRRDRVLQPIRGFRTGLIGGAEVETRYERPVSYGIRRCEFDEYLLRRSGARLSLGERLSSLERAGGAWVANDRIEAPLVVGAGGHFCPVARQLGARHDPRASVVAAQEIEFAVENDALGHAAPRAEMPELFFCDDLLGYGWCFRKENFLNIGLGRVDRRGLAAHVGRFCEFLRERGKVNGPIPQPFHGHAYQLYERTQPKLVDEGVLLVGDAAGLAYPQSGEGIRPAVESGLLAADVIRDAAFEYRLDRLAPYQGRLEKRLGKPRMRNLTDWLPVGWLRFAAARLLASERFARRVVIEDWFLHARVPALPNDGPSPPSDAVPDRAVTETGAAT